MVPFGHTGLLPSGHFLVSDVKGPDSPATTYGTGPLQRYSPASFVFVRPPPPPPPPPPRLLNRSPPPTSFSSSFFMFVSTAFPHNCPSMSDHRVSRFSLLFPPPSFLFSPLSLRSWACPIGTSFPYSRTQVYVVNNVHRSFLSMSSLIQGLASSNEPAGSPCKIPCQWWVDLFRIWLNSPLDGVESF